MQGTGIPPLAGELRSGLRATKPGSCNQISQRNATPEPSQQKPFCHQGRLQATTREALTRRSREPPHPSEDPGQPKKKGRRKGEEKGYQWRMQSRTVQPLQSLPLVHLNHPGYHFPSTADSSGKGRITFPIFRAPSQIPLPESPQGGTPFTPFMEHVRPVFISS